jgi:WD40 repeat protein
MDGAATIWSVPGGRRLVTAQLSHGSVLMLAFDPAGRRVATATTSGRDAVLDAGSGKLLYVVPASGSSGSVAFSPDGTKLLTSGGHSVRVWDAATGARELDERAPGVEDAVFSPDGTEVAAGGNDGLVRIWSLEGGAQVRKLRPAATGHDQVYAVAYSRDGRYLAAGTLSGGVVVWNAATGDRLATLHGHTSWVGVVQFTADGRHLMSSSDDGTVRIWDWRPGSGATVASGIQAGASLGFTDHGDWLSVAMPHNMVYLLHCLACQPLTGLEALAARQVRQLTPSERRTYLHVGESQSSKPY